MTSVPTTVTMPSEPQGGGWGGKVSECDWRGGCEINLSPDMKWALLEDKEGWYTVTLMLALKDTSSFCCWQVFCKMKHQEAERVGASQIQTAFYLFFKYQITRMKKKIIILHSSITAFHSFFMGIIICFSLDFWTIPVYAWRGVWSLCTAGSVL